MDYDTYKSLMVIEQVELMKAHLNTASMLKPYVPPHDKDEVGEILDSIKDKVKQLEMYY